MPAEGTSLSSLMNIGSATERWLNEVGIYTEGDLEAVGAVEAWTRLKRARPDEVTLVGLYALQGALLGIPWNALPEDLKERIKVEAQS